MHLHYYGNFSIMRKATLKTIREFKFRNLACHINQHTHKIFKNHINKLFQMVMFKVRKILTRKKIF